MSSPPVVNLYDAKTQLSALVERAASGEEIIIAKAGRPLARLVAYEPRPRLRFGSLEGKLDIPEDFDRAAADEIERMFNGPEF